MTSSGTSIILYSLINF
jgi:hypothetical protein